MASGGPGSGSGFLFARYRADGSLDTSFDGDGMFSLAVAGGRLRSAAVDAQNRIVAVGENAEIFNVGTFVAVRIKVNGSVPFDYDGDGRADYSVFRPSNSTWYMQSTLAFWTRQWGAEGDKLAPADYDGDGKTDLAIFRPSNTGWYVILSESSTFQFFNFGEAGDLPMSMDWDADGIPEPTLFRPSDNYYFIRNANGSISLNQNSDTPGEKPIRGDFDGDGRDDLAVYNPGYLWTIRNSTGTRVMVWGQPGDIPVPGDYDGDGKTDITVWRPSTGQWFRQRSRDGLDILTWGEPGDRPVPADYDGDGVTDVAIFRPSNGTWYIIYSSNSHIVLRQFGETGDIPTPGAFIN